MATPSTAAPATSDELLGAERILAAAVPGGRFVTRVCDVRDEDAVTAVVDEVASSPSRSTWPSTSPG